MSQTGDKRRRSDLDLFVLALVDSGASTPYELQRAAGLSPGATVPVLRRLADAGLLLAGKPGSRGQTDHKLTAQGRRHLQIGWPALIEAGPSGDLDADLPVALLALWVGGDRRLAVQFLQQSADRILESVGSSDMPSEAGSFPLLAQW